jgi:SAM-dependent methyltransferase
MAAINRLTLHYDTKYTPETPHTAERVLTYESFPCDRYEACLKFFSSHFTGGDVLELGAGSSLIPRSFVAHGVRFTSYTLSELSTTLLDGLHQTFKDPRIRVLKLDAESIPSNEYGKYDAVVMIALIEHLIDPLGAMQQIKRLLKPGGFVYIDTPNIAKFTRRAKLFTGRFPSTASKNEGLTTYEGTPVDLYDEGHFHYFTYRSLSLMLTQRCGFSKVEKFGYFLGPGGRRLFGHRFGDTLARYWPELFSEIVIVAYA